MRNLRKNKAYQYILYIMIGFRRGIGGTTYQHQLISPVDSSVLHLHLLLSNSSSVSLAFRLLCPHLSCSTSLLLLFLIAFYYPFLPAPCSCRFLQQTASVLGRLLNQRWIWGEPLCIHLRVQCPPDSLAAWLSPRSEQRDSLQLFFVQTTK